MQRRDAQGQLWKTIWVPTFVAPDLPGTLAIGFGFNDLLSGAGFFSNLVNSKASQFNIPAKRTSESVFTPDAMAAEGVR